MKTRYAVAAVLLVLGLAGYFSFTSSVHAVSKGDVVKMTGWYTWSSQGDKRHEDLVGTFTYQGKKKWDALFTFKWGKDNHKYTGTVTGSLTKGKLKGTIQNDAKNRTFVFEAKVKKGKLVGNHWEITNKKTATGVFEMETVKEE